ncbi:hypothetical protein Y886_25675 [Xanthomonas hyacinthi DSM 19077]|nr:hypothetical protein Y886_25675 [Xanthomonas hyacinthi DSM 19077]
MPPSLLVSSHELARLQALLESPALQQHPAALALGAELGRALLGLAVGQSVDWQAPGSRALRLRVLAVQAADAAARATR